MAEDRIRLLMVPRSSNFGKEESGIRRLCEAYEKYLPDFGVDFVGPNDGHDVCMGMAGMGNPASVDVSHLAGLYWTADYVSPVWEYASNARIVQSIRQAREITVPSEWVAETLMRDLRVRPHVVPHGIDWDAWQHNMDNQGYVLWNKNRFQDVCDPAPLQWLAAHDRTTRFVSTFVDDSRLVSDNITITGLVPHKDMRALVMRANIYLATTKETFGIGTLEAMAAGVPVLGFNWGGTAQLVEHGVTGYLAKPGDMDDLLRGLQYCTKHRAVLGHNASIAAKGWTWAEACRRLVEVLRLAMRPDPPTVGVVIPVYNKHRNEVERAIKSVKSQNVQADRVVVVDDGSSNGAEIEEVVDSFRADWPEGSRLEYVRQDNGGVARARNLGIELLGPTIKYVVPLDADDAIAPDFLGTCVRELEADRSLGVAYTGLRWYKGDNSTGVSPWPGQWNYDRFLLRQNQVPTCAMFRREMWRRLGGYRARYAPHGAGSEDAEFWLRAGAYGWKGKKVTEEALFLYSWMTGQVSGDAGYQEVDWLAWHPWVRDGAHPFASYATPVGGKQSHAVRQYDQPTVSVVIPIGPDHEEAVISALDSLEAQTFRNWEAIVVLDTSPYGEDGEELRWYRYLLDTYPYARVFHADQYGRGPGAARNIGAKNARGPFLLFLDADDYLAPDALNQMLTTWNQSGNGVYSDYVGMATVKDVDQLAPNLRQNIISRDEKTGLTAIRYYAKDFDCALARLQPEDPPYLWGNVTTLIPTVWHDEIGGFDEEMPSWEDVDYWWRMAWAGKCFTRIPEPLLVYKFYTGKRRDRGRRNWSRLIKYITKKKEGIEIMGCGCGGKSNAVSGSGLAASRIVAAEKGARETPSGPTDNDYVMVIYTSTNRGAHAVNGIPGSGRRYGRRSAGQRFLVHRADVAAFPDLFKVVTNEVAVPTRATVEPGVPVRMEGVVV